MQYFGGKARIAKELVKYLKSKRKDGQVYIEPFVGSGWVMERMDGVRFGYDKHKYLIAMFKELQNDWIPPTTISEQEYFHIKDNKDENPHLTGFVGFGCSFAGKWFGGYARTSPNRKTNYCLSAHNSILKKMDNLKDVTFEEKDYTDLNLSNALIYCDPPYKGTTGYGLVGEFDSNEFWNKVREWSKDNFVVVSEYNAPEDFVCVWEKETITDIRNGKNKREARVEKLFIHKSLQDK